MTPVWLILSSPWNRSSAPMIQNMSKPRRASRDINRWETEAPGAVGFSSDMEWPEENISTTVFQLLILQEPERRPLARPVLGAYYPPRRAGGGRSSPPWFMVPMRAKKRRGSPEPRSSRRKEADSFRHNGQGLLTSAAAVQGEGGHLVFLRSMQTRLSLPR